MLTSKGLFINSKWTPGAGPAFHSADPCTGKTAWSGQEATPTEVASAVEAARKAFPAWADLPLSRRTEFLQAFAGNLRTHLDVLVDRLTLETGKPRWEAKQEVETMIGKVANSLEAYKDRSSEVVSDLGAFTAVRRHRPHGVVAVLGPFNLPGHLPHSHIVPALLAGNTVVYKPSELTPGVGEMTTDLWAQTGLPRGVLNLVQGGRNTGVSLSSHPDLDGLYFTGSYGAGLALHKLFADKPGKILALEMGGNNPLVVWDCADSEAAAHLAVQSAYITSGQRCVCARRLILPEGPDGDRHLAALLALLPRLRVGPPTANPEPFLGPVISPAAADRLLASQVSLIAAGAKPLVPVVRLSHGPAFLSPGLLDVTGIPDLPDEEYFGPLLQVLRVKDFDAAIEAANKTRYGLAAGLVSDKRELWDKFANRIRAGVINWNRQTTGASGKLPFGGVGDSGNHRPSAYAAADYVAYPVASLETPKAVAPTTLPTGIDP